MKPSKYRNKKVAYQGDTFASKLEYHRYLFLCDAERHGVITDLQKQVSFELFPQWKIGGRVYKRATTYVADFTYKRGDTLVVEDTKGVETPVFKLKEIAMHFILGIDVRKVKRATENI